MKFVHDPDLDRVVASLNFMGVDCRVSGGCELYIFTHSKEAKRLRHAIEKKLLKGWGAYVGYAASPNAQANVAPLIKGLASSSAFGNISESASRKIFANLILAMNETHGDDYDFSQSLTPDDFERISMGDAEWNINWAVLSQQRIHLGPSRPANQLSKISRADVTGPPYIWSPTMWQSIDAQVGLRACKVFSLRSPNEVFAGETPAALAHHYFFYNSRRRRVCYLYVQWLSILNDLDWLPDIPYSDKLGSGGSTKPSLITDESSWEEDDLEEMAAYRPKVHRRRRDTVKGSTRTNHSRRRSRSPTSSRQGK